ncbi:MAG: FkbM family methyltransferase [Hyphomonas sp.]|jgi:FkbM family methyltransferase|uniref:FkbM family methyltransferase n=1 Tax=Hyphomonas sp. TaxID=87 RepID=UPI0037BF97D0|nr:FkbM family methyltransferase [Hyphomonas sp.]
MLGTGDTIVIGGRKTAAEKLFKAIILPVKALMNGNQAELGMLQALIPAGSTTIDVGANVGDFTRRLHELSKGGLVIAFEPQTMPRTVLSVTAYVRRKASIMLFPFALGAPKPGAGRLVELKVPIKSKSKVGSGLAHIGDETDLATRFKIRRELVPLFSLDEIMAHIDCPPVSLIKIDVEGGELDVLRGATETLRKHRPAIVCEIDNREGRFGIGKEELTEFLKGLGYVPRRITDLTELPWTALDLNTVFTLNT